MSTQEFIIEQQHLYDETFLNESTQVFILRNRDNSETGINNTTSSHTENQ